MTFDELKSKYIEEFLIRRREFSLACDRHESKSILEALTKPIVPKGIAEIEIGSIMPDDFVILNWDKEAKCWLFRYNEYTCRIFTLGNMNWYIINITVGDVQLVCPAVFEGFSNLSEGAILSEAKRDAVINCIEKYITDTE